MAEPLPSPSNTVVVPAGHLGRLWTMTVVSLVLNAVIIVLLLVGAIIHHHQMHREFRGGFDRFGSYRQMAWGPGGGRMMGMNPGWGRPGGFRGGPGPMGGPGMGGMMGGDKGGPPKPANMSQDILDHLAQKLDLTDNEKAKIKPILDEKVAEIRKQMEAQQESNRKQLEDAKAKIRPLLTPDQQKELDEVPVPGQKPPGQ